MVKIKAVIFDYGGTLAKSGMRWNDYKKATQSLLAKHGYKRGTSEIYDAVMETVEYRLKIRREESRESTANEFFNHILNILDVTSSDAILEEMSDDLYIYNTAIFPECLTHLLEVLSSSYKIALLSNTWIDSPRVILDKFGYSKWFDVMVCSCDLGIPKPDPTIFHHTLKQLGVLANEAVMIGDNVEADMKGADLVGIHTVWIENEGDEKWNGYSIKSVCDLPNILKLIEEID